MRFLALLLALAGAVAMAGALLCVVVSAVGRMGMLSGTRPDNLGVTNGHLGAVRTDRWNAVSSTATSSYHQIAPLATGPVGGGEGHPGDLARFDASGRARMVDVGSKDETTRTAVATGRVEMQPETIQLVREGRAAKGDVLAVAQVAAIMGEELGRPITSSNPSPLAFARRFRQRGYPGGYINVMLGIYLTTRLGMAAGISPDVELLLGRPPITLRQYVKDYAKAFES